MTAHTADGFLSLENLTVEYPLQGGRKVHAVTDFTAHVADGQSMPIGGHGAERIVMEIEKQAVQVVANVLVGHRERRFVQ